MNRHLEEKQVLEEMITWIDNRIKEMNGEAPAYKDMKESLEWELKTVNERIKEHTN